MSTANERQHGGSHYKKFEYEHWDFVTDVDLPYLTACASKYPCRWREKGGLLDLEKSVHFLDKAIERGIGAASFASSEKVITFCNQLPPAESQIVQAIVAGSLYSAKDLLAKLIEDSSIGNECLPA